MRNDEFGVITFKSTNHAIKGESLFKKDDIGIKMIPTPREITHSCGLSIKFDLKDIVQVENTVDKYKMDIDGLFKLIKGDNGNRAEKLN